MDKFVARKCLNVADDSRLNIECQFRWRHIENAIDYRYVEAKSNELGPILDGNFIELIYFGSGVEISYSEKRTANGLTPVQFSLGELIPPFVFAFAIGLIHCYFSGLCAAHPLVVIDDERIYGIRRFTAAYEHSCNNQIHCKQI